MNVIDNLQKEIKIAYRSLCTDNGENKPEEYSKLRTTRTAEAAQHKNVNEIETGVEDTFYSKTRTNVSRKLVFKNWTSSAGDMASDDSTNAQPSSSPPKSASEFNRESLKQHKESPETIESKLPHNASEARYLRELQQFREENGDLCFGERRKLSKRRYRFGKGIDDEFEGTYKSDSEIYEREHYDAGYFRVGSRLYMEKLEPPKVRFVFLDSDEPVHERPLADGEDFLTSSRALGSPRSKILVDNGDAWGREIMDVKESKPVKISVPKSVIYPMKDKHRVPHRRRSFDPADSIQIGDYLHRAYRPWIPDKRIPVSRFNDMSLRRRTGADRREQTPEI